ncbi:MAG: hypothetical protein ABW221_01360 [Vicinamibacteria bacterium]
MNVFTETVWYLGGSTAVAVVLLGVLLVVGSPVILFVGVWPALSLLAHAAAFAALLVVCGVPANLIFVVSLRETYYHAGDPIVDWLPWVPSGDWVLSKVDGGHYMNGGTVWTLRKMWLVLAVATWAGAFWAYGIVVGN